MSIYPVNNRGYMSPHSKNRPTLIKTLSSIKRFSTSIAESQMFHHFAQADVIATLQLWNPKIISYILADIVAAQLPTILVP
jgi:hypothetical protein